MQLQHAAAAAYCVTVPHWITFKIHDDKGFDLDFVIAELVEQEESKSLSLTGPPAQVERYLKVTVCTTVTQSF